MILFQQRMWSFPMPAGRRLLLLAEASSLYPGVLQEMTYAARRQALLLFHSSAATKLSIFARIRNAAGGPELMRTIVNFL